MSAAVLLCAGVGGRNYPAGMNCLLCEATCPLVWVLPALQRLCMCTRVPTPPACPTAPRRCGYVPPSILTSSKSGQGRGELLAHVAQLREFFTKQNHSTLA